MANIVKRRDGRGFEREILTLTKLRTAIVIDENIDLDTHVSSLHHIDALIVLLGQLVRRGINIDTAPGPVSARQPEARPSKAKKTA